MRARRSRWGWRPTFLLAGLVVALCSCSSTATSGHGTPTLGGETPLLSPTATSTNPGPVAGRATVAWTQFATDGAIQLWIAALDGPARMLATLTQAAQTCQLVAAGLPMLSPDGTHLLVSEGERCNLILDPGPLLVVDVASGQSSVVPLPNGATVLPQLRSYGWADSRTLFAVSQYNYTNVDSAYLYTLGAAQAETLAGLDTPTEGVVRGSTLFYLETTSGEGGIQSILRRYDLARRAPLAGGIDLGAYAACSECPDTVISPGWDVAADGGHVVYQRTTPQASGGFATSQILYATADGSHEVHIAQYLATNAMVHLRLSPDGTRVAITAAYPTPAVVTACVDTPGGKGDVDTPGGKGDPCFATYRPDAASFAAWSSDGHSFLASTVDASYDRPTTEAGDLVRYTLGAAAGQSLAAGVSPWSAL